MRDGMQHDVKVKIAINIIPELLHLPKYNTRQIIYTRLFNLHFYSHHYKLVLYMYM